MNEQEKWTGGRTSDRGLTEIAILLTLLIFVAFGFVFYFFYQKVTELSELTRELTLRLEKVENRAGENPVYSRKWAPAVGEDTPAVDDRSLPDLKASKVPDSDTANKDTTVGGTEEIDVTAVMPAATQSKVSKDIQINIISCADKMMYFYCDLELKNLSRSGRKVLISNRYTNLADHSGNTYNVSSFSFGSPLGEEVREETEVFVSKARPINVRFRFFDPPSGIQTYANVQFEVDETVVPFENIEVAGR